MMSVFDLEQEIKNLRQNLTDERLKRESSIADQNQLVFTVQQQIHNYE